MKRYLALAALLALAWVISLAARKFRVQQGPDDTSISWNLMAVVTKTSDEAAASGGRVIQDGNGDMVAIYERRDPRYTGCTAVYGLKAYPSSVTITSFPGSTSANAVLHRAGIMVHRGPDKMMRAGSDVVWYNVRVGDRVSHRVTVSKSDATGYWTTLLLDQISSQSKALQ